MQILPSELSLNILSYLPYYALLQCALVSKKWRMLSDDPSLWRVLCKEKGWEWKQPELLQSQFKSICICLVHSSSPSILTLSPFLSSGLIHTFRLSRSLWMSQQSTAAKPSLQGVRIKARKGAVKAQAKHEPSGPSPVFLIKTPLHTPLIHAFGFLFSSMLRFISL